MERYTKKMLRSFVTSGMATDITNANPKDFKGRRMEKVAYCTGTFGISGGLLVDADTGERFVILARSSTLFYFF